jgi:hypothetical protein
MRKVFSFDSFLNRFKKVRGLAPVYAFILFDERPSQRTIEQFVDEQFDWLDNLAASAKIYCFAFIKKGEGGKVENHSIKVAQLFGIRANQLPGVVVFSSFSVVAKSNDGIYIPMKSELLDAELTEIENYFADLFSLVQDAQAKNDKPMDVYEYIAEKVRHYERQEKLRPIIKWAAAGLQSIVALPKQLLSEVSKSFGQEVAKRMFSG